jgi:outer membrane murein-binding lipoprotein Lpp
MIWEVIAVIIAAAVALGGYLVYREKRVIKQTKQEDKLDTIVSSVNEIRDDVKALNGLKVVVDSLIFKVDTAQKTADKAHERLDKFYKNEKESDT